MSNSESSGESFSDPMLSTGDMDELFGVIAQDFGQNYVSINTELKRVRLESGSIFSYHTTNTDDIDRIHVFIRPSAVYANTMQITTNSTVRPDQIDDPLDSFVVFDYLYRIDTGFTSERITSFKFPRHTRRPIPPYCGPAMLIDNEGKLKTIRGSSYNHESPKTLFGGWSDDRSQRIALGLGNVTLEEIMHGMLDNKVAQDNLLDMLGMLGVLSHRTDVLIDQK